MKRPAIVRLFSSVTLALGGWAMIAVGCGVEPVDMDTQADVEHIGEAELAAAEGFTCSRDHNVYCDAGLSCCPGMYAWGTCRDLQNDELNCGTCGHACSAGQVCASGHCCESGKIWCAADQTCISPTWECVDSCSNGCAAGTTCCNYQCKNLQTDEQNCGVCGYVCSAGKQCVGGSCVPICTSGKTLCGTTCVDLLTNPDHCGSCTTQCPPSQLCIDGFCESI